MLPSSFIGSKPFYIHWEEKFLSVHAKFEKTSQCWQVFYLSGNEIWMFFPENLYFSIPLTSEILVSNKKLQPFTLILFGLWHVFFLSVHEFSLLFGKPDKHFACQLIFLWLVDKQKACQCSFSTPLRRKKLVSKTLGLQWQAFCLSVDNFKSDWQAKSLSVKKCSFFDTTDK